MTEEVAGIVLRNNYLQTLCLTLSEVRSLGELGYNTRLMHALEAEGLLHRAVEACPTTPCWPNAKPTARR